MFHLSHCNARVEEFSGYSDAEQDAVIHDFRQIIIAAKLTSFAAAIDRRAWNDLVIGPYREVLGEPLKALFVKSVNEVIRIVEPDTQGNMLAAIFDKGIKSSDLEEIADVFYFPRLISVTFGRLESNTSITRSGYCCYRKLLARRAMAKARRGRAAATSSSALPRQYAAPRGHS